MVAISSLLAVTSMTSITVGHSKCLNSRDSHGHKMPGKKMLTRLTVFEISLVSKTEKHFC